MRQPFHRLVSPFLSVRSAAVCARFIRSTLANFLAHFPARDHGENGRTGRRGGDRKDDAVQAATLVGAGSTLPTVPSVLASSASIPASWASLSSSSPCSGNASSRRGA